MEKIAESNFDDYHGLSNHNKMVHDTKYFNVCRDSIVFMKTYPILVPPTPDNLKQSKENHDQRKIASNTGKNDEQT